MNVPRPPTAPRISVSVASGCPYTVTDVAGHRPAALEDFVGEVSFTAVKDDQSCQINGFGGLTGSSVQFYEKDHSTGRDLRIWQVTADGGQDFSAQAISRY
ncbi:MAG: hypothetical protein ABWZ02_11090 [Nakamurella sp.]